MNIDCNVGMMPVDAPVARTTTIAPSGGERAPKERLGKGQEVRIRDDVQQIVTGLTTLAKCGEIDQAQSSAAERWYRDYVMGVVGARDPEARGSGKAPDVHASMLARTASIWLALPPSMAAAPAAAMAQTPVLTPDLPPAAASPKSPSALDLPLFEQSQVTTRLRGGAYEGLFRSTRPYAQHPGIFVHDL